MVNASLAYEILLYLNSFYFGMFSACEIGMGLLKAVNLQYTEGELRQDSCILFAVLIIESFRVYFGRKGSLADRCWQVILSVFLTIPCTMGVGYLLLLQHRILILEAILCALMLTLQVTEIVFAILFVFSLCRPVTYT